MYLKPTRRKKRRRLTNLIILIVVIIAALVGVFFLIGSLTDFQIFKPLLRETETILPETVQANENGILYTEDGSLLLRDTKSNPVWSLKLDTADTEFTASPYMICTYAQANVQALSYEKEQLFSISVPSEALNVRCGHETAAVLCAAADETGNTLYNLTLFNTKGEQTGQIDYKTRQVIDFGFTGDSDMLWALSLDTSSVAPISYITTYKSDGSPIGSIENNTQIVERVYVTADTIFASGTNNLISYNYFGEKQNEALIYGRIPGAASVQGVNFHAAYIPRQASVGIENAKLFSTDLSEIALFLPANTISVAITQNKFYAYTKDAVISYKLTGELEKTTKLDYTLKSAKQLSDTLAAAWDKEGKSYLMPLS
ncbi:MAG: hypothetical protein RSB97_05355 [Christensenella sp.]